MEIINMPKTESFHFRINPEVRKEVEAVYAKCGLTFTQAINVFIQQSLNSGGFPFPITGDKKLTHEEAMDILMAELEYGKKSGEPVSQEEVFKRFGYRP